MKKNEEYYNYVIEEKNEELGILKNNYTFAKEDNQSKIVGWLSIIMMVVTIMLGGMSFSAEGFWAGTITAVLIIYYCKLKIEKDELNNKIINTSGKIEQLINERDSSYGDIKLVPQKHYEKSKITAASVESIEKVINGKTIENNKNLNLNQLNINVVLKQDAVELARKKQAEKRIDMQNALLNNEKNR